MYVVAQAVFVFLMFLYPVKNRHLVKVMKHKGCHLNPLKKRIRENAASSDLLRQVRI